MNKNSEVDYQAKFEEEQKRRRGLQSENDKLKHTMTLKEAEVEKLKEISTPKLTKEETDELNTLKYTDPEAWREKMNDLDGKVNTVINEYVAEVDKVSSEKTREKRFVEAEKTLAGKYSDFTEVVTKEALEEDIPKRITNSYLNGTLSEAEYLDTAYKFITAQKDVRNPEPNGGPSLSKVTGGAQPSPAAVDEDLKSSYSQTIF